MEHRLYKRAIRFLTESAPQVATVEFKMPEGECVLVQFACTPEDSDDALIGAARSCFPVGYRPDDAISPPRVERRVATLEDIHLGP